MAKVLLSNPIKITSIFSDDLEVVTSFAFSPNDTLLVVGYKSGNIALWDITELDTPRKIPPLLSVHKDSVESLFFSNARDEFISISNGLFIIWDTSTLVPYVPFGTLLIEDSILPRDVLVVNRDNTILFSSNWYKATLRDLTNPNSPIQISEIVTGKPNRIVDAAFSPDNKSLAIGTCQLAGNVVGCTSNEIILVDILDPRSPFQVSALSIDAKGLYQLKYDNSGNYLAFMICQSIYESSGQCIKTDQIVLDIKNQKKPFEINETGQLFDNQDSSGDTSSFLDPRPTSLQDLTSSILHVPSAKVIFTGGTDGNLIVWNLDIDIWKSWTCDRSNQNLSRMEWNQYIGEAIPYEATCPNLPIPEE